MKGYVRSGSNPELPLDGYLVTLYATTTGTPGVVGTKTTDSLGAFEIQGPPTTSGIFYATAQRDNVVLMTLIGPELPQTIVINELTTVAAVCCATQFFDARHDIGGDVFGLRIAAAMHAVNLVNILTGELSVVLTSPPNHDQTITMREMRSLGNLLASCVRIPGACAVLFELATPPGGERPRDTVAALLNIARDPANHVDGVFKQSTVVRAYEPALVNAPDAWTLAVKVNDSGDDAYMFGGPGNLAFDANGNVWITNNVVQGTPTSTQWAIVLDAVGRPAVNSNGVRMSPFTGGGLLGGGFGVDIDADGNIWMGNFGWGGDNPKPWGSVSKLTPDAQPISPDGGYEEGIHRVQGTVIDKDGNVWLAGYGSHTVAVYPGGHHEDAIHWPHADQIDGTFDAFDIAFAHDGTAWVTNSNPKNSGMVQLKLDRENGTLEKLNEKSFGRDTKGIVIDRSGIIWVASGGDHLLYAFRRDGTMIGNGFGGGGIKGPWGIALDGDDNVWIGNFGSLAPVEENVFHGRLSKIAGEANDLGNPLTPDSGFTLPTGGAPVTLHNGDPLYGPGAPPCRIPMMRTTAVQIDQAGNVWTANNWKPDFDADWFDGNPEGTGNPGGDGMIIWLGLAKPPAK